MVRSLYSGVSGLKSHQTRMDVIGNNIANVNTYGFKASRTSFSDIYYQYQRTETGGRADYAGNNPSQVGYGVQVASIDKDMSMSNFQNTGRTLDMAISGDGLFICGSLDRNAQINSVTYTRMGNFGIDSVGNLVNANNEFVLGTENLARIDGGGYSTVEMLDQEPADTPNELDTININDLVWDAFKPECEIDYDDIPYKYKTPAAAEDGAGGTGDENAAATESTVETIFSGIDPYNTNRLIAYDYHMNGAAEDGAAGGTTTRYATDDDVPLPTGENGADGENVTYEVDADYILYNVNGKYVNNQGVIYDPQKGLYTDEAGNYYKYTCTTTKDVNGKVTKNHMYTLQEPAENSDGAAGGADGEAEFTDSTVYVYNAVTKNFESQDERGNTIYADMTDGSLKYSDLDAFTVGADGVLTAQYASQMRALARIEIATFDNVEGLSEIGDTAFIQTAASGAANIKRPGDSGAGEVQSSKLEMSNVNLANEFSDMIITQRGYQANARVITTSDSMLEELVNLKR